jgi:hypothetical protein
VSQASWSHDLLSNVNGPGGTNNETVFRVTRNVAFANNGYQSPFQIFPSCTVANMGMFYMRLKARFQSNSVTGGFLVLAEFKTGLASDNGDRKIEVQATSQGGSLGWMLKVATSNASASVNPTVWAVPSDPPADSVLANGNSHFFRGVFEDWPTATAAPNHDWTRWFTLELAFRFHSTSGVIAGNAPQGWTWVATGLGTTSAAVANTGLQRRFYIPGPNLYSHPLVVSNQTYTNAAGVCFPWNHYGASFPTNVGYEIGSCEIYDYWPTDATPVGTGPTNRPAEAV